MSAIWGIWNKDGKPVPKEIQLLMDECLSAYKLDSIQTWGKNNIHFGCGMQYITPESLNEVLPYYDENRGLSITADAIIDNRDELFDLLDIPSKRKNEITDSQLILMSYEKWGKGCPAYLAGDFAFAINDEKNGEIFCARDHVGKRTFYYYFNKDTFIFSTVIKSILGALGSKPDLNEKWITEFLSLPLAIHELECSETIYKDIYQLEPACSLTLYSGSLKKVQYWNPLEEVKPLKLSTDNDYEEAFKDVFFEAVHCRLRCIGNVGVKLSGGLDSGSVACIAAKQLAEENKRLKSFSSVPMHGYKNSLPRYEVADESEYIKAIGDLYNNIDITYCRSEGKHSLSNLEYFLDTLEQPHKIIENLFWYNEILENASRSGCKVLLNGQIGNMTVSYGDFFNNILTLFRKGKMYSVLKEINGASSLYKVSRLMVGKTVGRILLPYNLKKLGSIITSRNRDDFLTLPVNKALMDKWNIRNRFKEKGYYVHPLKYHDTREIRKYIVNPVAFSQIATVETKLGLAHGIVERDPTGDKRVMEFCLCLPDRQFVRNGEERYLIRRSMQGILPDKIRLNRSVRGQQSADWIQRLKSEWESLYGQIELMLGNEYIGKYIDADMIREKLSDIGGPLEEEKGSSLRMLLVTAIASRFIEGYNL